MGCPEPLTLSRHADGDLDGAEARQVTRHVAGCATCRTTVEAEAALGAGLARSVCPEPELLALFIDEALPADRADRVAGHVLACAPCRDVVTWTREAAAATDRRSSGRRRRTATQAGGKVIKPSWVPTLVGAAAAASILFMVGVSFQRTPSPGADQASAPRPRTERATPPRTTTTEPRRATEAATEAPRPVTDPTASATEAPATEAPATERPVTEAPATEAPATERPVTERPVTEVRPGTEGTGTQAPTVREPAPIEVAAVPGARSVRWRDAQGEGELSGVRALRPGTRLLGGRAGGALRVGSAELRLEPQAATRLDHGDGVPRLSLEDGELTLEAARADVEVACGPVVIRPAPEGVFLSLASDGADHVVVCCMSGQASLGGAGVPAGVVRPGDAVRVGREGARPARRDPRLAKAEESAIAAALASGLDAPRGVRLAKLIEEAARDLEAADAARRAWAAYALLTARTDRDPKPTSTQLASAAAVVAEVAARADLDAAAAVPALLGLATSVDGKQADEPLARLAAAIAARAPAELLVDTEALLALRVAERRTAWRAPRALWVAVAGAAPEGWAAAARVALARPLDLTERRSALAALDARLVPGPAIEAAVVLEAARALALLDPTSEPRRTALLARAAETPRDPRLAVALALDAGTLLGERAPQAASAPASVVARRLEDGRWRVTFVFRTGRRPKAPTLHGSWDTWAEPGVALRERPDGSFSATLVLPAGRYEYKVRLAEGARWEHDPGNPLTAADGQGGLNSVVILE
jgi:hypothetical protein